MFQFKNYLYLLFFSVNLLWTMEEEPIEKDPDISSKEITFILPLLNQKRNITLFLSFFNKETIIKITNYTEYTYYIDHDNKEKKNFLLLLNEIADYNNHKLKIEKNENKFVSDYNKMSEQKELIIEVPFYKLRVFQGIENFLEKLNRQDLEHVMGPEFILMLKQVQESLLSVKILTDSFNETQKRILSDMDNKIEKILEAIAIIVKKSTGSFDNLLNQITRTNLTVVISVVLIISIILKMIYNSSYNIEINKWLYGSLLGASIILPMIVLYLKEISSYLSTTGVALINYTILKLLYEKHAQQKFIGKIWYNGVFSFHMLLFIVVIPLVLYWYKKIDDVNKKEFLCLYVFPLVIFFGINIINPKIPIYHRDKNPYFTMNKIYIVVILTVVLCYNIYQKRSFLILKKTFWETIWLVAKKIGLSGLTLGSVFILQLELFPFFSQQIETYYNKKKQSILQSNVIIDFNNYLERKNNDNQSHIVMDENINKDENEEITKLKAEITNLNNQLKEYQKELIEEKKEKNYEKLLQELAKYRIKLTLQSSKLEYYFDSDEEIAFSSKVLALEERLLLIKAIFKQDSILNISARSQRIVQKNKNNEIVNNHITLITELIELLLEKYKSNLKNEDENEYSKNIEAFDQIIIYIDLYIQILENYKKSNENIDLNDFEYKKIDEEVFNSIFMNEKINYKEYFTERLANYFCGKEVYISLKDYNFKKSEIENKDDPIFSFTKLFILAQLFSTELSFASMEEIEKSNQELDQLVKKLDQEIDEIINSIQNKEKIINTLTINSQQYNQSIANIKEMKIELEKLTDQKKCFVD